METQRLRDELAAAHQGNALLSGAGPSQRQGGLRGVAGVAGRGAERESEVELILSRKEIMEDAGGG